MLYLIDGYNLLFRLMEVSPDLQSTRDKIIEFLKNYFQENKLKGIIVFDGATDDLEMHYYTYGSLSIIFTSYDQSADDYIIESVENSSHRANLLIVSSDNKIINRCKQLGASNQNIEEFMDHFSRRRKKSSLEEDKNIEETKANIERLEKIFLKRLKNLRSEDSQ